MFTTEAKTPTTDSLNIDRLPKGGYVVRGNSPPGFQGAPLFASTDIDGALAFIKKELDPNNETARPDGILVVNKANIGSLW